MQHQQLSVSRCIVSPRLAASTKKVAGLARLSPSVAASQVPIQPVWIVIPPTVRRPGVTDRTLRPRQACDLGCAFDPHQLAWWVKQFVSYQRPSPRRFRPPRACLVGEAVRRLPPTNTPSPYLGSPRGKMVKLLSPKKGQQSRCISPHTPLLQRDPSRCNASNEFNACLECNECNAMNRPQPLAAA